MSWLGSVQEQGKVWVGDAEEKRDVAVGKRYAAFTLTNTQMDMIR
jgi:hypothetical protein